MTHVDHNTRDHGEGTVDRFDRVTATERVATMLASSASDGPAGEQVAVVLARFDDTAAVIEAFGPDALDLLVDGAVGRVAATVGSGEMIGRIGDSVILAHRVQPTNVEQLAERTRRAMLARLTRGDVTVAVGASVGAALAEPADGTGTPDDATGRSPNADSSAAARLLARARSAADAARDTGGRIVVVDDQHPLASHDRLQLASALTQALQDGEFGLEYQPIVATVSEELLAVEALLRWDRPFHGRIVAADFVGVAETAGLMPTIGEWVLEQACADLRWLIDNADVNPRLAVHVNISDTQLTSTAVVGVAVDTLREHRLHPSQLVVEIREATLVRDRHAVERCVRALRRVGVRVAVDRFGTGPDPLGLLSEGMADIVKLDRQLALPGADPGNDADNDVARAVVLLARSLDMHVVAERVDDVDQLRRLRAAGCDMAQGHLLGRPQPVADLAATIGRDQLSA